MSRSMHVHDQRPARPPHRDPRRAPGVVSAPALVLAAAALSLGTPTPARAATGILMEDVTQGCAQRYCFAPASVVISPNTNVVWTDRSGAPHDITFSSGSSGTIAPHGSYSMHFTTPGSYRYRCTLHTPYMTGVINVAGPSTAPVPPPPAPAPAGTSRPTAPSAPIPSTPLEPSDVGAPDSGVVSDPTGRATARPSAAPSRPGAGAVTGAIVEPRGSSPLAVPTAVVVGLLSAVGWTRALLRRYLELPAR